MPKEFGRNRRVSDLVQRELAVLIQREMDSKRFGLVTISAVDVSPDLLNARVFVTSMSDDCDRSALVAVLNDLAGHFRYELAKESPLRKTPRLEFEFDGSVEYGTRLSALIDSVQNRSGENED